MNKVDYARMIKTARSHYFDALVSQGCSSGDSINYFQRALKYGIDL